MPNYFSPSSFIFNRGNGSQSTATASWQLAEPTKYEIEQMVVRFTRSGDGYSVKLQNSNDVEITRYVSYDSKPSGETHIDAQIPSTYWQNLTSGTIKATFQSPLYSYLNQQYNNIELIVSTKAKAGPSTAVVGSAYAGSSQTITISNQAPVDLAHKVTLTYGSTTYTATAIKLAASTTCTASCTTDIELCALNTTGTTISGNVTIDTYLGTSTLDETAKIGQTTATALLTTPSNSSTQPSFNSNPITVTRDSVSQAANANLRRHVNVSFTHNASAKYGASIVLYILSVTNNSTVVFQQSYAAGTSTLIEQVDWPAGTNTLSLVAVDSRGIQGALSTQPTVVLVDYDNPVISDIDVQRCQSSGVIDDEGEYMRIDVAATADDNALPWTLTVKAKKKGAQSWGWTGSTTSSLVSAYVILGSSGNLFSTEETYQIEATVTDSYGSYVAVVTEIGTQTYTIYRMAGGKGVAFGTVAKKFGVEVNESWPFYTHGQEIQEMLLDYAHPVGSVLQTLDANFNPNTQWPQTYWGLLGTTTVQSVTVYVWVRSR